MNKKCLLNHKKYQEVQPTSAPQQLPKPSNTVHGSTYNNPKIDQLTYTSKLLKRVDIILKLPVGICLGLLESTWAMFGNRLALRKWTDTLADLIDMRKKVRIFYIKK